MIFVSSRLAWSTELVSGQLGPVTQRNPVEREGTGRQGERQRSAMGSQYTYQRVQVLHKSVRIYHPPSVLTEEAVNLCSLMPDQWLWGFSQTKWIQTTPRRFPVGRNSSKAGLW